MAFQINNNTIKFGGVFLTILYNNKINKDDSSIVDNNKIICKYGFMEMFTRI
jgi:hypothetical protein